MSKQRLDMLIVERGLAESREQAQRIIMAGQVTIDGNVATKAGHRFDTGAAISVKSLPRFVSRGGEKLQAALDHFHIAVNGRVCLDAGASTGGFTDCLLQYGAARVFAVDVGRGQLHWKLRNDPRVVSLEGVNARHITADLFPCRPEFAVADVSFISLTKVLPAVKNVLTDSAELVTLIKPQFEAGRAQIEKGGVVRDPSVRQEVIDRIRAFGQSELGLSWEGCVTSPLKGPAGNVEFLAYWRLPP